jgi:hypothetical protein
MQSSRMTFLRAYCKNPLPNVCRSYLERVIREQRCRKYGTEAEQTEKDGKRRRKDRPGLRKEITPPSTPGVWTETQRFSLM